MPLPITVRSHGVNLYLVECRDGRLLVDAGWPRSLPDLKRGMEENGLRLSAIRYAMTTHAHPDHAGLMQKLKRYCGVRLLVHERQIGSLAELNRFFERKPDRDYEAVRIEETDLVVGSPNRDTLRSIGVTGEIVETPGHSDDSVSLVLEGGEAFVGDLTRLDMATRDNTEALTASWKEILRRNVARIYPAHGGPIAVSVIEEMLRNRV